MTTPHPMFISIFRAYGVTPADEKEERCPCEVCRSLDEVRAFLFKAGVVRECAA